MTTRARIIALGNEAAGDDAAGILAARRLEREFEVVLAGRPGADLLELLESGDREAPTILVDVTHSGQVPGQIVRLPLAKIADASIAEPQVSSHGLGPSEVLRLGAALGRALPPGEFVGIEGARFEVGQPLSPLVALAIEDFVATIRAAAIGKQGK